MYKLKKSPSTVLRAGIAPIVAIIIVLLVLGSGGTYYAVKKQKERNTAVDKERTEHDKMTKDEMMKHENMTESKMMKQKDDMIDAGMAGPKTHQIEMTQNGFLPKELTIKKGDKVEFINKDSVKHWPASAMHPTHKLCPGFDSMKGVDPGATYSFTFNEIKACPFHDHLFPNLFGKILVE